MMVTLMVSPVLTPSYKKLKNFIKKYDDKKEVKVKLRCWM